MIKHSYHLLKTDWIALTSTPFWMFNIFSTEKKFALKKNDMSEQSLNISLNTFHPLFVYGCKNNISFILFFAALFFYSCSFFIHDGGRVLFLSITLDCFKKLERKAKNFFLNQNESLPTLLNFDNQFAPLSSLKSYWRENTINFHAILIHN